MVFEDLRDYISFLEKNNDLIQIQDAVDPYLELTYILDREEYSGRNRSILFENVKGSQIPVVGNLFSGDRKMEWILGQKPYDIGMKLRNLIRPPDESDSMISRGLELLRELSGLRPKMHNSLPSSMKVLDKVDLDRYPICTTWPKDGGPFVTLPVVITKNPLTGARNAGMYRLQKYDSETLGMHWQIHKGGSQNMQDSREEKKIMDVAVTIGTDPLTIFSAVAPLPDPFDEFSFTGLISGNRVDLVKGSSVDIEYPMNSEIVLEGYVDPTETRIEGPFGDHTGYYSLEEEFPIFHVKRVIERKNPVYPTTIVGKLWHEDVAIGKAIERMFLPLIRLQIPEIVDLNTMEEAVFHNMVVVSIKKRYPGHARKVMFSIWGTGQLMFSKFVLVVDDDINIHDRKQVIWAMTTRVDPARDITIVPRTQTDALDHASEMFNFGSKVGIDATRKWKEEGFTRRWPDVMEMEGEIVKRAEALLDRFNK